MDCIDLQVNLKEEHRKAGFRLEEDEHFLYIYDKEGKHICTFSSRGATPASIQNEVDILMKT